MLAECLAKIRIPLDTDMRAETLAQLANSLRPVGSPWTAENVGHVIEIDYRAANTPENVRAVTHVCNDITRRFESRVGFYVRRRYAIGTEPPCAPPEAPVPAATSALYSHKLHVDHWRVAQRERNRSEWYRLEDALRRENTKVGLDTWLTSAYVLVLQLFTAPYGRCTSTVVGHGHGRGNRGRDAFDLYVTLQILGDPLDEGDVGYADFVKRQLTPPRQSLWQRAARLARWLCGDCR